MGNPTAMFFSVAMVPVTIWLSGEIAQEGYFYSKNEATYTLSLRNDVEDINNDILEAINEGKDSISLEHYSIPTDLISELLCQLLNSNPYLYYISFDTCSVVDNYVSTIYINYKSLDSDDMNVFSTTSKLSYNQIIQDAISLLDDSMSDLEKTLALHDYLVLRCDYDIDGKYADNNVMHTAYSALVRSEERRVGKEC